MIYNYTKCESVIAKIMADLDSSEARQKVSDIKEWIFEAVDKIGAPVQYIARESGVDGCPLLKIEDNQVPLPQDLITLDGVAFSEHEDGPWVPMVKSTSIFKSFKPKHNHEHVIATAPHDKENKAIDDAVVELHDHQQPQEKMFTSQSQIYTINGMKYAENNIINQKYNAPKYFIKPGWIATNKNKGFVKIAYKAIPTDERGYPLIPDLSSYREAIYWYVTMKLSFAKWMKGQLGGRGVNTGQNIYAETKSQWNFYRNQAYAEAMMPTAGDIENIKNDWNKLVPDFEGEDRFFDNISDDQQFYSDYYYGY